MTQHMKLALVVSVVSVLLSSVVHKAARAATLAVPDSYPTIQAAISAAATGDEVVIADGVYKGTANKNLDFGGKAITVCSASGSVVACVIDCEGSGRGFYFHTAETAAAVVSGLTIRNGSSTDGGAIQISGASPTITNCVITACTASNNGGGVSIASGSPAITSCQISGNTAKNGGGIYHAGSGTVFNCTLSGNTATTSGGGLAGAGTLQLLQNTVSGNNATGSGGGVRVDGGTWTIRQCTIAINKAGSGGGISRNAGTVTLINTLVGFNTAGTGTTTPSDLQGAFDAASHHYLVRVLDGATGLTAGPLTGTASIPLDPRICLLGNNGGMVLTHALLPDSPALDAGDNAAVLDLTTDQCGVFRFSGTGIRVDIGAIEGNLVPEFVLTGPAPGVSVPVGGTTPITWDQKFLPAGCIVRLYYDPDDTFPNNNEIWTDVDVDAIAAGGSYAWAPILLRDGQYHIGGVAIDLVSGQQWPSRLAHHTTVTSAGTVYTVNSLEDVVANDGVITLREALMAANTHTGQGDAPPGSLTQMNEIRFAPSLSGGTISLSGFELPISENVWIQGPGSGQLTIDARGLTRVFNIAGGTSKAVWITGLKITHGNPGIASNTPLTLDDVSVSACTGSGVNTSASITARNCLFSGNSVTNGSGAGLSCSGGGSIENCAFSSNTIAISSSTTCGGAAIYQTGGVLTVKDTQITGNSTTGSGYGKPRGAIYKTGGTLNLVRGKVSSNSSACASEDTWGGGICNAGGTLTVTDAEISGNSASSSSCAAYGGGIYNANGASLSLVRTSVWGNSAKTSGGGVYNAGILTMDNSTLDHNTSASGCLYSNGTATLSQVTISTNTGTGDNGGGLRVEGGTCAIRQSTIANNTTVGAGGGIFLAGGNVTLCNTIVAGNTASGAGKDVYGSFNTTSQYNLIGIVNDSIGLGDAPSTRAGTLAAPLDARLGILSNNGGVTKTHRLLSASPAIDAGSAAHALDTQGLALTYDQRGTGFARVGGGSVDIGATEGVQALAFHLTSGPTGAVVAGTLVDITWPAQTAPMGSTIDFFADPDGSINGNEFCIVAGADADDYPTGYPWQSVGITNSAASYTLVAVLHTPTGQAYTDRLASTFHIIFDDSAVYTVDSLSDVVAHDGQLTLREALQAANLHQAQGDAHAGSSVNMNVIRFAPSLNGGTISLSGFELPISENVWIQGLGSGQLTIDARGLTRVFNITGGAGKAVWITGLKITRGNPGIASNSPLTLDDVGVSACTSNGINTSASITARNSLFSGNSIANGSGAGLSCSGGGSIENCTFSGNTITIGNSGTWGGAAIYQTGGLLTIKDTQITGNSTTGSSYAKPRGAIYKTGGTLNLVRGKVSNNSTASSSDRSWGGGICNTGGTLTVTDAEISGNTVASSSYEAYGGGIYNANGASLSLVRTSVWGNSAKTSGGGLYNAGTLTMDNCTLDHNTSSSGALFNDGTASLSQVTISTNTGGGVRAEGGTCTIRQSSIVNNTTTGSGGGIYLASGTLTLYNTIVATNTASDAGKDVYGTFSTASQYNLIGIVNDSLGLGEDPHTLAGVLAAPLDPMLHPLTSDGGPTATHRPRTDSPVIDMGVNPHALDSAGKALQYDQRGAARFVGGTSPAVVDIGSVEYEALLSDNQSPTITGLTLPGTVRFGDTFTLTAAGVTDDHAVASVSFYRDINGNGQADPEELLGADTSAVDGWTWQAVANWTPAMYTFLAVATDDGYPLGTPLKSSPAVAVGTITAIDAPVITVGNVSLRTNRTDQRVPIYVSGLDRVTGLNITAMLGNGSAAGAEPLFYSIDYTGSIWAGASYLAGGGPVPGQPMYLDAAVAFSQTGVDVQASGLLMTLVIDTRNLPAGQTYDLKLSGFGAPAPQFVLRNGQTITPIVTNGTVRLYNTTVVGRYTFYNNSSFDGHDPAATEDDDDAIATDKTALRLGGAASFANYTSYSKGLNGIMIDVQGLQVAPNLTDFEFRAGNNADPATWPLAPTPAYLTFRPGAGTNGSDRITLAWNDYALTNKWLQVRLKKDNTGLENDDVFYFGNAIGECGNNSTNTFVDGTDIAAARDNFTFFLNPANLTNRFDYGRDKYVNAIDMALARDNPTNFLNSLLLIAPSVQAAPPMLMATGEDEQVSLPPASPVLIDIGTVRLQAGRPGQKVSLRSSVEVQPALAVSGFNLRTQIGDGAGGTPEPLFEAVSFTGGMWDAYPTMTTGGVVADSRQYMQASVLFADSGVSVAPTGPIATLTIDTTGFAAGQTFPLKLAYTDIGQNSDFILTGDQALEPGILNGTIELVEALSADINGDNYVNVGDLQALVSAWASQAGPPPSINWNANADCNKDGYVNVGDLQILVANWARSL